MLLTDNDSLTHKIETQNVSGGFNKDQELFDFCNYPKD